MQAPNRREQASGLPLAFWPALTGVGIAVGWASVPVVAAMGGRAQLLGLVPDWAWLGAVGFCVLVAIVVCVPGRDPRRWRCLAVATIATAGPLIGTLQRDLGLPHRAGGVNDGRSALLLFLNANDPGERRVDGVRDCDRVFERLVGLDADVAIVVNPGWRLPSLWRRAEEVREGRIRIRWVGSVMVASRHDIRSMRIVEAVRGIDVGSVKTPPRAIEIELAMPDDVPIPERILVVDLPSEQGVDRISMATEIAGRLDSVDSELILGDLNMAPRSPALSMLAPGFKDAFRHVGSGWGGTWPRTGPWLRIDFALVPEGAMPGTIRTFDPGAGGHRGLILEYSD